MTTTKTTDPITSLRKDRDYRSFVNFELRAAELEGGSKELYVEGYAATFEQPTVLFEVEGRQYKEVIDARAFEGSEMSDVIFNYNHAGRVFARTRNGTLKLDVDSKGLHIRARVDGTQAGRELYEEIEGRYIDRMSFAFTIAESSFNRETLTRRITKFKRIFDVSAVDIPAYDTTAIGVSARNYFQAQEEALRLEAEAADKRRRMLLLAMD